MMQLYLAVLGVLVAFSVVNAGCDSSVVWGVTQSVGGTCPSSFNGIGGDAFDAIIRDIIDSYRNNHRQLTNDNGNNGNGNGCGASNSATNPSCVPWTEELDDDSNDDKMETNDEDDDKESEDDDDHDDASSEEETKERRLDVVDGCNQCTGTDDDGNDASTYGHDDDDTGRRLTYTEGGEMGAILTYSITAEVPDGEDPLTIMSDIEDAIATFFADEENARVTWITKARELGSDMPEDTQVIFSSPEVEEDSVHISRPGDFIDHHYNSNSNVRLGTWIGAGVAGIGLMVSAKYGMKAYKLKHDADVIEQEKAAEWANVEETAGELTMNPLAGGVRQRTNSAGDAM